MKSRPRDDVSVGKHKLHDWKSLILRDILDLASVVTRLIAMQMALPVATNFGEVAEWSKAALC